MKKLAIPDTDLTVSALCYGTGDIGHDMDDETAAALFNVYRDGGGNFIDTAHAYSCWTSAGAGSSELAIARYLKTNPRNDFVIATKGGHPGMGGYRRVDRYLDPCRIRCDIEDSLGRLEVDTIDLYYLHRDDTRCGVGEIIDMLNREIQAGTIRYLGASNWTKERIRAANEYAARKGLQGFVISQAELSLAHKEPAEEMPTGAQNLYATKDDLAFHADTGLPLCAYTSAAKGYFADGTDKGAEYDSPLSRDRRARARKLAGDKGCAPTQIALAWLMNQDFPCIPITGSISVKNLKENLGAAEILLTREEVRWLYGS